MKKSAFFLSLLFGLSVSYLRAQTPAALGQNEFDADVLSQWWSWENKGEAAECDMRILNVRPGEFEMNCVNWTKGFSGSVCTYSLSLSNDFFSLSPRDCKKTTRPGYIYGYRADSSLYLLFSQKPLTMDSTLLRDKNWTRFSRIKR